jgi:predicted nucleotidyltransferase
MVCLNDLLLKRGAIHRIAARHGARHVAVFGSFARAQATDASDIDLLVDLDADRSLLDRIALKHDLEDLLGRPVDVINRKALDPALCGQILRERVDL